MHTQTSPIVGELSLTVEDGTTLTAGTDVALAEQWARHALAEAWDGLTFAQQVRHTSDALAELRRTYHQTEETRA